MPASRSIRRATRKAAQRLARLSGGRPKCGQRPKFGQNPDNRGLAPFLVGNRFMHPFDFGCILISRASFSVED
jgi:hypothetical protein